MRRKTVFAAVLATLVLAVAVVSFVVAGNTQMEQRDSLTVYCLAPSQHDPLTSAAVALGLDVPGDLARWRDERPDDFWRACEALSAARQAPGPGVFATVLPVLTAVLGALLAFMATAWRDRVTRDRELATELREKAAEFHRVATARLDRKWRQDEPSDEVDAARAALATPLARVRAAHPDWPAVVTATEALAKTRLDDNARDDDALNAKGLDDLRDDIERIARSVERPVRALVVAAP